MNDEVQFTKYQMVEVNWPVVINLRGQHGAAYEIEITAEKGLVGIVFDPELKNGKIEVIFADVIPGLKVMVDPIHLEAVDTVPMKKSSINDQVAITLSDMPTIGIENGGVGDGSDV